MKGKRYLYSAFVSLLIIFCQETKATSNEDIVQSEEISAEIKNQTQGSLVEDGPPDSHEAMNNREITNNEKTSRRKRSYEFLMGLVKRNSTLFEIGRNGQERRLNNVDFKASESLLELLVKIAADPEQWAKVHEMLQQVDTDLTKSKDIIEKVRSTLLPGKLTEETTLGSTSLKPTTKNSYQKNFAYHRVTGKPSIRSNNKSPKAYIAVSVIAPKSHSEDTDDLTLENELKELKPWTHRQNLKNMAAIRSKWVIQDDDKKTLYAPQ